MSRACVFIAPTAIARSMNSRACGEVVSAAGALGQGHIACALPGEVPCRLVEGIVGLFLFALTAQGDAQVVERFAVFGPRAVAACPFDRRQQVLFGLRIYRPLAVQVPRATFER